MGRIINDALEVPEDFQTGHLEPDISSNAISTRTYVPCTYYLRIATFNIRFLVTFQHVFNYDYYTSTYASAVLNDFKNHWNSNLNASMTQLPSPKR